MIALTISKKGGGDDGDADDEPSIAPGTQDLTSSPPERAWATRDAAVVCRATKQGPEVEEAEEEEGEEPAAAVASSVR